MSSQMCRTDAVHRWTSSHRAANRWRARRAACPRCRCPARTIHAARDVGEVTIGRRSLRQSGRSDLGTSCTARGLRWRRR